MFTTAEKLACVLREVGYRKYVYDKRVATGKMSAMKATREIELMEEIAADYKKILAHEQPDLLKRIGDEHER
jgi:hypothetical protein